MIIESLIGIVMNVFMADNATGQNLTRGVLMAKKLHTINQESIKEETHQLVKDTIIEIGEQKNDNGNP